MSKMPTSDLRTVHRPHRPATVRTKPLNFQDADDADDADDGFASTRDFVSRHGGGHGESFIQPPISEP